MVSKSLSPLTMILALLPIAHSINLSSSESTDNAEVNFTGIQNSPYVVISSINGVKSTGRYFFESISNTRTYTAYL